jgi:hypothetical protein
MNKLGAEEDYESIMWARMHICTNLLNGALHAKGITPEDFDFNHTWYLADFPDQSHMEKNLDGEFRKALRELLVFENLRETYVRGPAPYGAMALAASDEVYFHIREFCRKHIGPL